jgi:hypothetical protein
MKLKKKIKSPDNGQIPAELIQAGGVILRSDVHKLITSIRKNEELPGQWKGSITTPIKKEKIIIIIVIIVGYQCCQIHTEFTVYPPLKEKAIH